MLKYKIACNKFRIALYRTNIKKIDPSPSKEHVIKDYLKQLRKNDVLRETNEFFTRQANYIKKRC